jgi:uncharacterized protein YciI
MDALFIVLLRLSANRGAAREHARGHRDWLSRGVADGVFLFAGTLEPARGGVILATGVSRADLDARVSADPFVREDVVRPEILEVTPSQAQERLAFLLGRC